MVRVFGCKSQEALWMLRREHVYWFYCCNRHQQNVLGMQAQAIGHPIPDNLSLFTPHLPLFSTCKSRSLKLWNDLPLLEDVSPS